MVTCRSSACPALRASERDSGGAAGLGEAGMGKELGVSACLGGFEPIEPTHTARDATLMGRIEGAMGEFRASIDRGASPDDLAEKVAVLGGLFDDAEAALAQIGRASCRDRVCQYV